MVTSRGSSCGQIFRNRLSFHQSTARDILNALEVNLLINNRSSGELWLIFTSKIVYFINWYIWYYRYFVTCCRNLFIINILVNDSDFKLDIYFSYTCWHTSYYNLFFAYKILLNESHSRVSIKIRPNKTLFHLIFTFLHIFLYIFSIMGFDTYFFR